MSVASVHIIVVWCDLSICDISWRKEERVREMYARAVERGHGDGETGVIEKMRSREFDRREARV